MDIEKAKSFLENAAEIHGKKHRYEDENKTGEQLAQEHWLGFMKDVYTTIGVQPKQVEELGEAYNNSFIKGYNNVVPETAEKLIKSVFAGNKPNDSFSLSDELLKLSLGMKEPKLNFTYYEATKLLEEGYKGYLITPKGFGKWSFKTIGTLHLTP